MSWLKSAIDRGIRKGCDKAVSDFLASDAFKQKVRAMMAANPRLMFIKKMQARYQSKAPGLTDKQAFEAAREWLNTFLQWEKVEFGDPAYDWTTSGAIDLADADMEYWERAA